MAKTTVKTVKIRTKEYGTETSRFRSQPRAIILCIVRAHLVYENTTGELDGASLD
jgi:hypothetical protein